jgi:predicted metalloendopeptidase
LPTPRGGEGLGLTAEQLFFVGYAQVWCNSNSREYELAKMASNAHPPSELRVRAVIANSEQFARAFNCPAPDPPVSRCGVW